MFLKCKAFVLRSTAYSESDLIVTFLTPENGCIQSFVRGAKKSKKRFGGGVLQAPHLVQLEAQYPKNSQNTEFFSIKEAKLLNDFSDIKTTYSALTLLATLIKLLLKSEFVQKEHYNLFGFSLIELALSPNLRRFFTHFVVRYLSIEGVLPDDPALFELSQISINKHRDLLQVSTEQINKEVAVASHFLQNYTGRKGEFKWPK